MSDSKKLQIGAIEWVDLTVENAEEVRDFYRDVVGWEPSPVSMGAYDDFNMNAPETGEAMAGICHARGANADLPAQWLVYIRVDDVDKSAARCVALGGTVISGPKGSGSQGRYCVIQDPAGAVAALYAPPQEQSFHESYDLNKRRISERGQIWVALQHRSRSTRP